MKQTCLDESNTKRIILATYMMCAEGYDCKELDTLIFATSKSDIIQSVGRILRQRNPYAPLILDVYDLVLKHQYYKRLNYYKSQNFKILGELKPKVIIQTPARYDFV
jgi:superfamily II DNA or RNA helicase